MRGRKPTPTHLKLIKGNPGKRPINPNEPKPELARPLPPPHLNDDAKVEWGRVIDRLFDLGLMTDLDRAALGAYCQAYGRWSQAERALLKMAESDQLTGALMIKTKNGNAIQNPLVGTANHAMSEMMRYASEFGMTPSARTRIDASFGAAVKEGDEAEEGRPASYF